MNQKTEVKDASKLLFDLGNLPGRHYTVEEDGKSNQGVSIDGSALTYFVEEFIARSAVRVAIGPHFSFSNNFKEYLTKLYRGRVYFPNIARPLKKCKAFLAPVYDEFGVEFDGASLTGPSNKDDVFDRRVPDCEFLLEPHPIFELSLMLLDYFLAIEENLQVELDLDKLIKYTKQIKSKAKSPETRYKLSILESIWSSYVKLNISGIVVRSEANQEIIDLFLRLVEEDLYLELSMSQNLARQPKYRERALNTSRHLVESIIKNKKYKNIFNYGQRIFSMISSIPMPSLELLECFTRNAELPSISSFSEVRKVALRNWLLQMPDIIPVSDDINKQFKSGKPFPNSLEKEILG